MNLTIEACKYCFIASCKDLPFLKQWYCLLFGFGFGAFYSEFTVFALRVYR